MSYFTSIAMTALLPTVLFAALPFIDANFRKRRPAGWGLLAGTPLRYALYVAGVFVGLCGMFSGSPVAFLVCATLGWAPWALYLMVRLGPRAMEKVRGRYPSDPDDMRD